MGCGCTNNCGKSTEEISEFNTNNNNSTSQYNDIFVNNPKLLSKLIKIQSHYRGMKTRETTHCIGLFGLCLLFLWDL